MSVYVEVCSDTGHANARKAAIQTEFGGNWESVISEGHEEYFRTMFPMQASPSRLALSFIRAMRAGFPAPYAFC